MKRTERHHLKEDEVAHGLNWIVEFYKKYRRETFIVAGAIAFVALIFGALTLVRSRGRSVENQAIGKVGDLAAEIAGKPEKLAELEKLAEKGRAARLANLELARYWAERKDWAKAESYAGRSSDGRKDFLYYQTEDLKAQVALGKGDFDKAIAIYEKIGAEKPKVYPLDVALFRLAECRELKGETKEALDIYKKLQAEYPQSYFGYDASLRISKLEIKK